MIRNMFWIRVSRQCRHAATAELRVERGHCARLRLYWNNGKYNINPLHLHSRTCYLPVTALCWFQCGAVKVCLYRTSSSFCVDSLLYFHLYCVFWQL